jgi:phage-related protein
VYTGEVPEELRPVRWVGSALRDLKGFPRSVQRDFGQALYAAQCGEVYTVRFGSTIYVLHAFMKKANKGRETPRKDIELIKARLATARQDHMRRQN